MVAAATAPCPILAVILSERSESKDLCLPFCRKGGTAQISIARSKLCSIAGHGFSRAVKPTKGKWAALRGHGFSRAVNGIIEKCFERARL